MMLKLKTLRISTFS